MKQILKHLLPITLAGSILVSCNQVEQSVQEVVESTKSTVQQKVNDQIGKTIEGQITNILSAKDASLSELYPQLTTPEYQDVMGKHIALPTGKSYYYFNYPSSDHMELLNVLSEGREQNKAVVKKLEGSSVLSQLEVLGKWIPGNYIDVDSLKQRVQQGRLDFYQVKTTGSNSTLIFDKQSKSVLHIVNAASTSRVQ